MTATVTLLGGTATITDGDWTASRPEILPYVRGVTAQMLPPGYVADLDLALAEEAARLFKGRVTDYQPSATPEQVY